MNKHETWGVVCMIAIGAAFCTAILNGCAGDTPLQSRAEIRLSDQLMQIKLDLQKAHEDIASLKAKIGNDVKDDLHSVIALPPVLRERFEKFEEEVHNINKSIDTDIQSEFNKFVATHTFVIADQFDQYKTANGIDLCTLNEMIIADEKLITQNSLSLYELDVWADRLVTWLNAKLPVPHKCTGAK